MSATTTETPIDPMATAAPVAFLYPGLGDHYAGMGQGLYETFPEFAAAVDECLALITQETGDDSLRAAMFPAGGAKPGSEKLDLRALLGRTPDAAAPTAPGPLDRTGAAQPALFVVEYALTRLWQERGLAPAAMAGYSVGEYVAACVAGVVSLPDALKLVCHRAQWLDELPPGAMLAVALAAEQVEGDLVEGVWVSAHNSPELCVLAGVPEAVDEVQRTLEARGVVTRRVRSQHAFHTPLMEPVAERLTALAASLTLNPPRIPYISNVTGAPMTDADALDPSYWARHLSRPVLFQEGLAHLADHLLLEVGPGQTLSSIATAVRGGDPERVVASMRHSLDGTADAEVLERAVQRLTGPAPEAVTTPETPADGTPAKLAAIWQRLLKRDEPPATTASFFDIGGNSLLAARLALRVQREFGTEIALADVYRHPSIQAMTAFLAGDSADTGPDEVDHPADNWITLGDDLVVSQQNESETRHFYEDIFEHRGYVRHGVRIDDGATVVDVGGNIGLFTLFAHREAKDVRLLTFEPAPPMVEHVRRNVTRHGVNATVFPIGLSDHEGTAEFAFYPRSSGMSTLHPDLEEEKRNLRSIIANQPAAGNTAAAELEGVSEELLDVRFDALEYTVTLRRLSDVIREQGLERIDLLKVDVQKEEKGVLDGIDEEHWPLIRQVVAEVHDGTGDAAGRLAEMTDDLRRRGFSVTAIQDELYQGTDIHNVYAVREDAR